MKSILKIFLIIGLLLVIIIANVLAQVNLKDFDLHETRTFAKNPIYEIQLIYLDNKGNPSYEAFLRKNNLYPQNPKTEVKPFFTVSFLEKDLRENNGSHIPIESAELLNLDFHLERSEEYSSGSSATSIWDGRVYLEENTLVVGGYSSKFNERPVGVINDMGLFVPQLLGKDSEEFPILKWPSDEILFDPFEWRLLRVKNGNEAIIEKNVKQFLPLDIHNPQSGLIKNMTYKLEYMSSITKLILYGILGGKKIELASCNVQTSEVVKAQQGFRPELIEGCKQGGKAEIVTLTFQGEFSNSVSIRDTEVFLITDNAIHAKTSLEEKSSIKIDGNFQDWRNIRGVSDEEGDHVSYLYPNPDTDLLDFKLTNDDKYLYFYSRVSGAHGRTGEKGRYYWYVYIDVDRDPETGYPPTRDDNCYFGIPIGDDSEAQFEFVSNKFVKTFFGFTGIGAEKEVLSGNLELGPSFYSPKGQYGKKRDSYKIEYVNRENSRFITHDYTPGTSEDIIIALSPDGSEVEVRVELAGFLKDLSGKSLMFPGKKIDIAVGVEGSSNYYGSDDWGADSSPIIYGYEIK